jgi:hypothetical protein
LKPAWAKSSQAPVLKKIHQKSAGGVAQGVGPEFSQKKKEKKKIGGFLPQGREALISLFKDQFANWKARKIWVVPREGLGGQV